MDALGAHGSSRPNCQAQVTLDIVILPGLASNCRLRCSGLTVFLIPPSNAGVVCLFPGARRWAVQPAFGPVELAQPVSLSGERWFVSHLFQFYFGGGNAPSWVVAVEVSVRECSFASKPIFSMVGCCVQDKSRCLQHNKKYSCVWRSLRRVILMRPTPVNAVKTTCW